MSLSFYFFSLFSPDNMRLFWIAILWFAIFNFVSNAKLAEMKLLVWKWLFVRCIFEKEERQVLWTKQMAHYQFTNKLINHIHVIALLYYCLYTGNTCTKFSDATVKSSLLFVNIFVFIADRDSYKRGADFSMTRC